jgi:hypothetical protein
MGNIPKDFIVDIDGGHQGRRLPLYRRVQRSVKGPDLPGGFRSGKGGKKPLSRFKGRFGPVQAAELQTQGPEAGSGYPQGQGQGEGTRSQVRNGVSFSQREGQDRKKPDQAVEIPGEEIPEVCGKQSWPAQVAFGTVPPARSEKPGKFSHIPAQAGTEPSRQGKNRIDKAGKPLKETAAFRGKFRRKRRRRAGFYRRNPAR